jgi:hypothetical protein
MSRAQMPLHGDLTSISMLRSSSKGLVGGNPTV